MIQTIASRPADGKIATIPPKTIDSAPAAASSHSPLMIRRRATAAPSSMIPVKIAQAATIRVSSTSARPGRKTTREGSRHPDDALCEEHPRTAADARHERESAIDEKVDRKEQDQGGE